MIFERMIKSKVEKLKSWKVGRERDLFLFQHRDDGDGDEGEGVKGWRVGFHSAQNQLNFFSVFL